MQPGQLEQQNLQIEQQQRALADQKARTAALQEWSAVPGSMPMSELPRLILKHGGSADASLAMQQSILTQQAQLTTLDKDKLANAKAHTDAIGAAAQAVLGVSPENRAQAYALKMKELAAQGIISPQEAQTPYDEDMVKLHAATAMTAQEQIDTELKKRETAAQELKAQTEMKRFEAEMPGGPLSPVEKTEMNDWLARNPGKGPADWAKYRATLVPAYNFNLQQSGGSNNIPLTPAQQATATAILEGRMTPPSSFALKTPYWQNIMGKVFEQDPEFSEQRAQLRKGYTVGSQSKEINAINTALGHVGALGDAVDALNNNNVQALNKVANAIGVQIGNTPATTLQTIVNRVGPELVKAYSGTGGSEAERAQFEKDFSTSMSPAQLKTNVSKTVELLRSKISALENQWDQNKSAGMPSFQDKFIMPGAKAVLQKQGAAPSAGMIRARDPQGKLHEAPKGTPLPPGWKLEQ